MNIEELRLGNRVLVNSKEITVTDITGKTSLYPTGIIRYKDDVSMKTATGDHVEGIELINWIKNHQINKFIINLDQSYSVNQTVTIELQIFNTGSEIMCEIFNDKNKQTVGVFKLDYLHQLQNLYFALSECKNELPL